MLQGRQIEIFYVQYLTEKYTQFTDALAIAETLHPTDIVINFGIWFQSADAECAAHAAEPSDVPTQPQTDCPSMQQVCSIFRSDRLARLADLSGAPSTKAHLWWATAVPQYNNGTLEETLAGSHPMNVQAHCMLNASSIIDRRAALDYIEPDRAQQAQLWWWVPGVTVQSPHVDAEANHAFNHAMLEQFVAKPPRRGAAQAHRLHMFGDTDSSRIRKNRFDGLSDDAG